jgi:HPt (histidine-containing phosphotransfer) domain-containing protein
VLAEFVLELRRGLETLGACTATSDPVVIRSAVHRLAGVSRTLGAARLVWALEGLLARVGEADVEAKIAEVLPVLEDTLQVVLTRQFAAPAAEAARQDSL